MPEQKDYRTGRAWAFGLLAALAISTVGIAAFAIKPATGSAPIATATAVVKLMDKDGHGSGVHIGDGYILTAAHVVGFAKTMTLKASDGRGQTATTLWANKDYDVALMRASKPEYLGAADLDCSPNYDGQPITAYGHPMDLEFVSSAGRVVGSARSLDVWASAVPVDMTIVPGQSGGGVINDSGSVVGIAVGVQVYNMGVTGFGMIVPAATICMLLAR
jgi:serine protease Do